jgi:hypothetical protein
LSDFTNESAALLTAIKGGVPAPHLYMKAVHLKQTYAASANHHLWANPTLLLSGINQKKFSVYAPLFPWMEYYVPPSNPMDQNEGFTPHNYATPIAIGTWALACGLHEIGQRELSAVAFRRARAKMAWIALGVSTVVPKKVTNHYLKEQNVPHLFVGDGKPDAVKGIPIPGIAFAGLRGHLRGGGSGNHNGEIEQTNNSSLLALLAPALGLACPKAFRRHHDALVKRYPGLPVMGLSPEDTGVLRAFVSDPGDVSLAKLVFAMAKDFRPQMPFAFIRHADRAIEAVCWLTHGSSTGARAVDTILANGTHYIGSADTGKRDSAGDASDDVRPQRVVETSEFLACQWLDGGTVIKVPRPRSPEIYRVETAKEGARFVVNGQAVPDDPPGTVPPVVQGPVKKEGNKWTDWL